MPIQVFGAQAAVSMVNRALANTSPSNSVYLNQVAAAGDTAASQYAFAGQLGAQFAVGKTEAQLSAQVMSNIGVSNAILEAALTDYITFHGKQNIGIIALQLGQIISNLEGDVTFGAAATKWNQEVTNAYQYSSSTVNNTPQTGDDNSGSTNLTRFTDVLPGHQFTGFLDYNQFTGVDEQTLTNADRLTGTDAADDVLFAQLQNAVTRPTLNGIEIVSIDAKANAVALDLSDANGVKTIINNGSAEAAALTFQGLKNLVDVAVKNTNSNTAVVFNATVVAGTADALNLNVDGVGVRADRADVTVNGIETLNITASGNASILGTVGTAAPAAGVTKVTIAGDQNLSVGGSNVVGAKALNSGFTSTTLATVDASAATGNLFLNVSAAGATNQTITTGTGNDTVVISGLTSNDTVDLGAGVNRVVLTDAGSNQAAKLTNVQQIEARVVNTNLNLVNAPSVNLIAIAETTAASSIANVTSVKSGTTLAFEGEGAANVVGAANTATFGNVQFNLANATGSTDEINVTYNNAGTQLGTDGVVTIGNLTNSGNNVETLNLTFSDLGADDIVNVGTITVGASGAGATSALRTLTVVSDSRVALGTQGGLDDVTLVDASGVKAAFTANFTGALAETANVLVKTGGAGNNSVTLVKANDTAGAGAGTHTALTVDASAGTGNQAFIVSNLDNDVAAVPAASFVFTGGSGNDTLTLTSIGGSISNITGGKGVDIINLTNSAGSDRLAFSAGDSSQAAADQVIGANLVTGANNDKIDLRGFGFDTGLTAAVKVATVQLTGQAFEFNAGGLVGGAQSAVAVWTNDAVLANATSATVYVDVNGDAKLDANDLVINFTGTAGTLAYALDTFLFA